jgi:hypothetical protein
MFPPPRGAGALDWLLDVLAEEPLGVALTEAPGAEDTFIEPPIVPLVPEGAAFSIGSAAAGVDAGTTAAAAAFAFVRDGPALLTLANPAITKKLVMQIAVVVKLGLNLAVMGVVL